MGKMIKNTILKPMYLLNTGLSKENSQKNISKVTSLIRNISNDLSEDAFEIEKINLPAKLVAAYSGLGKYGRNNLVYIDGLGSYHWLAVYAANLPGGKAPVDIKLQPQCVKCNKSINICPVKAIDEDRYLLHPSRCITYYNEAPEPFPKWIDARAHNALIGCTDRQAVCPMNKKITPHSVNSAVLFTDLNHKIIFNQAETQLILDRTEFNLLPVFMQKKLESINFVEDYRLLARNLSALL
jgi:epoxyqueuosine reductase